MLLMPLKLVAELKMEQSLVHFALSYLHTTVMSFRSFVSVIAYDHFRSPAGVSVKVTPERATRVERTAT